MKRQIYTANRQKIIIQSYFIWVSILLQVVVNFHNIFQTPLTNIYVTISFNILLFCVTIPGLRIFLNYYNHAAAKQVIVNLNGIQFIDMNKQTAINIMNEDIRKIEFIRGFESLRLPWREFGYFHISDIHNTKVIVPTFIVGIQELWFDNLSLKITGCKLTIREKLFPMIMNEY